MSHITSIHSRYGLRCLITILYLTLFTSITTANEAKNFSAIAPGVIKDSLTGLEWMRCSVGQEWNEKRSTCAGDAKEFKWQEAIDHVKNLNAKGGYAHRSGWRLPTIRELVSIRHCSSGYDEISRGLGDGKGSVPRQCASNKKRPTIVHSVFPETAATSYWADRPEGENWTLNFSCGCIIFQHGLNAWIYRLFYTYRVRLVRESSQPISTTDNK